MSIFEEGLKLVEEQFGNDKDNVISLGTIAREWIKKYKGLEE